MSLSINRILSADSMSSAALRRKWRRGLTVRKDSVLQEAVERTNQAEVSLSRRNGKVKD